jgi:hypothetical protein
MGFLRFHDACANRATGRTMWIEGVMSMRRAIRRLWRVGAVSDAV